MTPEHWQEIKALLQSALERAPNERAAFLNEACAGNDSLRKEVESLIAAHNQTKDLIEQPLLNAAAQLFTSSSRLELTEGTLISHYKILRHLSTGGMGVVYLAQDTELGRNVALKLLPAKFTEDDERIRRFQQEARAASALNHPNILTVYEMGQANNIQFIATEFVEGETLRQKIARGRLPINETLEIGIQIVSALVAAHEAGIVHRDIKPENVMVRRDHLVKVLDFGLAKLTEQLKESMPTDFKKALVQTEQGLIMGTVSYMSPEQAQGLDTDARTDIWSVGVVLYEMATGRAPFAGEIAAQMIVAILEHEPDVESALLPAEFRRIIKKALRKDREERYQTSKDLLVDLKMLKRELDFNVNPKSSAQTEALETPTVQGVGPTTVTLTNTKTDSEKHKRTNLLTISLVLMVVALLGLGFLLFYVVLQSQKKNIATENANATAQQKPPDSEALKKEITELILGPWAESVNNHDLDLHISCYADRLDPFYDQSNVSRSQVRAERLKLFEQYSEINFVPQNISISIESATRAVAIFNVEWNYYGNKYSRGNVRQELWLAKTDGRWHIIGEKYLQIFYQDEGDKKSRQK
jgi:serine/threonine protein kinase